MITTTTTARVTFDEMLEVLLPAGIDGCLRCVAHPVGVPAAVDTVALFERLPGWLRLRHYGWKELPEALWQFLRAHQERAVTFSPIPWTSSGAPRGPAASVWATVPIPTEPAPHMPGLLRPEPAAAARAHALIEAVTPSVVIDEGDRLALGWLLAEPCDLPLAEATSTALACRLRGVAFLHPPEPLAGLLVGVPGTRNARLHPTPEVAVIAWAPERRYPVAALVTAP